MSIILLAVLLVVTSLEAQGARIKDICGIGGVRSNQLVGYGLAVGLMGTGDDVKNGYTRETIANMLSRQGVHMRDRIADVKSKNTAAVMVTANLPPFAKNGTRIDCTVSSLGDATSLQGSTLIMTPLRAPDGEIYAVCQGPILLGGFAAAGANASVVKNQTTVGIVANGALVEREVATDFAKANTFTLNLYNPDFTTVRQMASRLNSLLGESISAYAKDSATVVIKVNDEYLPSITTIISEIENVDVPIAMSAVVVLNEKTGTVVMGEYVRISTVAIAHGNLSITIKENVNVSQPLPFSPAGRSALPAVVDQKAGTVMAPGGQTVVTKDTNVKVAEEKKQLLMLPQAVTIQDVVQALNAIGVSPRDLITILQTIKAAGALQAELRII
ncbi:MAG TPA: flagellar basal body P-ring protein FlgI [Syntrophales bacterium]|nr:flagellar basal body P-ring protein FlgI [Syntrophales bacterium]